jgi:hypothetical protein
VQTSDQTVATGIGVDVARIGQRTASSTTRGLVFEESRTNELLNGSDLATGGGGATRVTGFGAPVITSGFADPAGGSLAVRVQAASGTNGLSESSGTSTSSTNTGSMWLRAQSGTGVAGSDLFRSVSPRVGDATLLTTSWARVAITGTPTAEFVAIAPVDGRDWSAVGGATAGARDVQVAFVQREAGAFGTEYIITTAAAATRAGERLFVSSGSSLVSGGRLSLELKAIPKGSRSAYSAVIRLWTVDANNYAEIAPATGIITVKIGGVSNTTDAIDWAANDALELWIAAGGSQSTVIKYRINGGAQRRLTVTGAALSTLTVSGAIDLLCNGTSNQFTVWVQTLSAYASGRAPTWALDGAALFALDGTSYTAGNITTPTGLTFSRASSATVQTSDQTVQTASIGVDVLRVGQYGATSASRGIVIEESRTNIAPHRDQLTNWTTTGATATRTAGQASPDGTSNAVRWQAASGAFSYYVQTQQLPATRWTCTQWTVRGSVGASGQMLAFVNGTPAANKALANTTLGAAWQRISATPNDASLGGAGGSGGGIVLADGRDQSAVGGVVAGARDAIVDLPQCEAGVFATEAIVTSGASATRAGERLAITTGSSVVSHGRLSLELSVIPKGARSEYGSTIQLWYVDANNQASIDPTTGVMTVKIGGVSNTTAAITWSARDTVDIWIEAGGSLGTVVAYRINAGATSYPAVTGVALGALTIAGALDTLCQGTANQLSCWLRALNAYPDGTRPTWVG